MAKFSRKAKELLKIAGPGIITGAADDDPSGIATYTQTGAQFGYGQLWTALFVFPLLVAVQEACARIGAVTGKGIAAVVKEQYSKKVLYGMLILIGILILLPMLGTQLGLNLDVISAILRTATGYVIWLVLLATGNG